jgi:hypothetical protein
MSMSSSMSAPISSYVEGMTDLKLLLSEVHDRFTQFVGGGVVGDEEEAHDASPRGA